MLKKKSLLLIEDDTVDAMAIKRAIDHTGEIDEMIHVVNGEEGLHISATRRMRRLS